MISQLPYLKYNVRQVIQAGHTIWQWQVRGTLTWMTETSRVACEAAIREDAQTKNVTPQLIESDLWGE